MRFDILDEMINNTGCLILFKGNTAERNIWQLALLVLSRCWQRGGGSSYIDDVVANVREKLAEFDAAEIELLTENSLVFKIAKKEIPFTGCVANSVLANILML